MTIYALKARIHEVSPSTDGQTVREIQDDINRIKTLGPRVQLLNHLVLRMTNDE